jgi:hypothetical protein
VSIETKAHQCHGGEHTSTDLHHDPAREILSSTLARETSHSAYCCVDIPLVTETPQLVVTDMVRGPVASYVPRNILGPDEGPALCVMNRVADPPPEQRTIAATVLLL